MANPIALQTSPVFFRQLDRAQTPFAFSARTASDARRWRRSARPALYQHLVGDILWRRCPLKPKRMQSVDRGDHVREKWMLTTAERNVGWQVRFCPDTKRALYNP